ncbi:MAG: winged helix-turn-helix domain-containing protein [Thermoplasmata archaeon]|nr:winged helix-turn-helix domain-containing protein [Thermoplasmata archaeon]
MPAFASLERPRPPPGRRREQSDLYATILEVVKRHEGGGRITRISYGAGMPVDRLRSAVARLRALGLVRAQPQDGFETYDITARGQEFLDTYWKMRGFIELLDGTGRPPTT